jgi:hypothetical protein
VSPIRDILVNLRGGSGVSRRDGIPFEPLNFNSLAVRCQSVFPILDKSPDSLFKKWEKLFLSEPYADIFHHPGLSQPGKQAGCAGGFGF